MRVLITGVSGFAGRHLAAHLAKQSEVDLHGTLLVENHVRGLPVQADGRPIALHPIDLREPESVIRLVAELQPDRIYHLAAQAFVPLAWADPWGTLETNIRTQLNVLEAARRLQNQVRVLVVGSNEEYGKVRPDDLPIVEECPLRPDSPYGVSKLTQNMLGLQYFLSYRLHVVRVRPFNHIGPGQNPQFVAPNFARQIAEIEAGMRPPVLKVGNLSARRDFSDVRDIVRAYALALEQGEPGEVYNVGSGVARSIQELLDRLLAGSVRDIRVETDPERLRPSDVPVSYSNPARLQTRTGWRPEISFETSVQDVLDDARRPVAAETGEHDMTRSDDRMASKREMK